MCELRSLVTLSKQRFCHATTPQHYTPNRKMERQRCMRSSGARSRSSPERESWRQKPEYSEVIPCSASRLPQLLAPTTCPSSPLPSAFGTIFLKKPSEPRPSSPSDLQLTVGCGATRLTEPHDHYFLWLIIFGFDFSSFIPLSSPPPTTHPPSPLPTPALFPELRVTLCGSGSVGQFPCLAGKWNAKVLAIRSHPNFRVFLLLFLFVCLFFCFFVVVFFWWLRLSVHFPLYRKRAPPVEDICPYLGFPRYLEEEEEDDRGRVLAWLAEGVTVRACVKAETLSTRKVIVLCWMCRKVYLRFKVVLCFFFPFWWVYNEWRVWNVNYPIYLYSGGVLKKNVVSLELFSGGKKKVQYWREKTVQMAAEV